MLNFNSQLSPPLNAQPSTLNPPSLPSSAVSFRPFSRRRSFPRPCPLCRRCRGGYGRGATLRALPFGPRISFTAASVEIPSVDLPLIAAMRSPERTPAFSAGESLRGAMTVRMFSHDDHCCIVKKSRALKTGMLHSGSSARQIGGLNTAMEISPMRRRRSWKQLVI